MPPTTLLSTALIPAAPPTTSPPTTIPSSNFKIESTIHRPSVMPIPESTLSQIVTLVNSAYVWTEQDLFNGLRLHGADPGQVFLDEVGDGWTLILTATEGKQGDEMVLGTVSLKPHNAGHAYVPDPYPERKRQLFELTLVAVDTGVKKMGLGARMLAEAERFLREDVLGKLRNGVGENGLAEGEEEVVIVGFMVEDVGNVEYYRKRGYETVGEPALQPVGTWTCVKPFTLRRMEKVV